MLKGKTLKQRGYTMLRSLLLTFLIILAVPLAAQDNESFSFGDDAFLAGQKVSHTTGSVDDLFGAGDRVVASAPITGSAHLVGRNVTVSSDVGENLYAAGRNVDLSGSVAGDAILAGEQVEVLGAISGDLRAMGSIVELNADVGDAALLAAETVLINAHVSGDLGIAMNEVEFGPNAVVDGELHIYADDPGSVDVPDRVASSDRIILHEAHEWDGMMAETVDRQQPESTWDKLSGFIGGILGATVLATLLAALAPGFVAGLRERALAAPLRTGWIGFLALSATIGSLVMFAITGFGLLLVPVSILASVLLGLMGYLVGIYVLGVALSGALGRDLPDSLGDRALAALIGAVAVAVIGLIPFLGWLFALALGLIGAGALIVRWFHPGFYTATE